VIGLNFVDLPSEKRTLDGGNRNQYPYHGQNKILKTVKKGDLLRLKIIGLLNRKDKTYGNKSMRGGGRKRISLSYLEKVTSSCCSNINSLQIKHNILLLLLCLPL
jgi:hypothetical protein